VLQQARSEDYDLMAAAANNRFRWDRSGPVALLERPVLPALQFNRWLVPALTEQEQKEQQGSQARNAAYGVEPAPPHEEQLRPFQIMRGGRIE